MASNDVGMRKILAKLEKRLNDHEYYEAHQLYRTLCFRYCTQGKYEVAIDLLMNGARALLEANQMSSGADLALLLVNTLEKADQATIPVTNEMIEKLAALHRMIPEDNIERLNYVTSILRWAEKALSSSPDDSFSSSSASETTAPVPVWSSLQNEFGITYWNERNYSRSRYHLIRSQNGEGCAAMLIEFHVTYGYSSEVDLFIAQAVLQFLCLRNRLTAESCFNAYTRCHPQMEAGPPFVRPLLNFLWLLLLAIEGGSSLVVFNVLCEKYKTALSQDPTYADYLTRIGQLFFHLQIPKPQLGGGLFGGLFSNLLTMEEDGEDARVSEDHCPVELD